MEGQRRMALERALQHCDPMRLRELYGLAVLGVPAAVVKLCLFSVIIGAANVVEVLVGLGDHIWLSIVHSSSDISGHPDTTQSHELQVPGRPLFLH